MMALRTKKTTNKLRAVAFVAAAGLLAIPNLAKAAADETFIASIPISVPNLASFDISWVDSAGEYLLADRSNAAIDLWAGSTTVLQLGPDQFVGVVLNPNGSTNNDLSGPNGVLTFNNTVSGHEEVWVGDGPQANAACPSFLKKCSVVKVLNSNGGLAVDHVIPTFGAARADELCSDPVDHVVMVANDAEADFSFGTPFISFISTDNYGIFKQVTIPEATNGIEQCKWDSVTGLFFLNLPEVNGPGNDTADGAVYVYDHNGNRVAQYFIDIANTRCAGPQGMSVGPEPQLLLGCNAPDKSGLRNSVIIDKHTGNTLAIAWGLGGADETYFDPLSSHYAITGSGNTPPTLAVVDGTGSGAVDQILTLRKFGTVSPHSVAAFGGTALASPNAGEVNFFISTSLDTDDPTSPQLSN